MPVWQIYHPENTYTDEDKHAIAQRVTDMYGRVLPRFYVNVFFHALPKASFYIGGEPTDDFVRVIVDHIARTLDKPEAQKRFMNACNQLLEPFIAGRGLRWEFNVDETPFDLWTINGSKPPPPESEAEARWRAENRASAYVA